MVKRTALILAIVLALGGIFMFPFQIKAAADTCVDLTSTGFVEDHLKNNQDTHYAFKNGGAGWVGAYSLFDMGSGKYLVYKIVVPAGQGVKVKVEYKAWKDVGNGGIHQYTSKPKTAWYVTEDYPASFSGNVANWDLIESEEAPDLNTYTYTHILLDKDMTTEDTEIYACLKFLDNDKAHAGKAGWNDGAWIDCILFETVTGKLIPVTGVSLSSKSITVKEGEGVTLKATLEPANATNRNLTYSSLDESIAIVTGEGTIIAKKPGTTDVTVKTEDGGFTAACTLTVAENHDKDIVLVKNQLIDTNILSEKDDLYQLPMSWYYHGGNGTTKTRVVREYGAPFRDFGSYAYAIFKLKVPANCNAQMLLQMRKSVTSGGQEYGGIVSGSLPRLNVYYAEELPLSHDITNPDIWKRAESDGSWDAQTTDYTFTVSTLNKEDRYVYVMLYSTFAGSQGAWIDALKFKAVEPVPTELFVKAPTNPSVDRNGQPNLDGMRVAIRCNDGSERLLTADEYSVSIGQQTQKTVVRISVNGTTLSEQFEILSKAVSVEEEQRNGCGSVMGSGTVGVALAAGIGFAWMKRRHRDEE